MSSDPGPEEPAVREPPGRWLWRCRRAAGLTQEDIAERTGLSVRTVRNLERGNGARPHLRSLRLMASALDIPEPLLNKLLERYRATRDSRPGWSQQSADAPGDQPPVTVPAENRPGSAGSWRPVLPRQLPPSVAHFAGRTAELATLDQWLEQGTGDGAGGALVISAIGGMAGVGKTALALRWAHRAAGQFPDGQLYVNLRGYDPGGQPADAAAVLRRFLDALGAAPGSVPTDVDEQVSLYRSLLAGRRMLILADNASDAAQVRPLLPGSPGCLVLVTSRSPLTGLAAADGARVLNLEILTAAEALELLSARLGAVRVAAEPDAVTDLIRLCGHLPLALALAAARAAESDWPLAHLAAELRDGHRTLAALGAGDAAADVRSVFSWSYRKLSAAAARMFRLLGVHPGPDISVPAAASLAGVPRARALGMIEELTAVSLISELSPGRFGLHDLLRAYAVDHAAKGRQGHRAAVGRMRDHYLHTANSAGRFLDSSEEIVPAAPPQRGVTPEAILDSDQALSWFRAEHKVLLAVTALAVGPAPDDHAWQLPCALAPSLDRAGQWHELIHCQNTALACAERLGDLPTQARTHRYLGRAQRNLGHIRDARAHFATAAALSHRLGDHRGEARAWIGFSASCESMDQLPESLSSSLRALALAESAGDLDLQAKASNNVGYDYAMLGDPGQGLVYCRRALHLLRQTRNRFLEAHTWDSLGYINVQLGDYQRAITSYQRAVALFRQTGAPFLAAQSLTQLGDIYDTAGDLQQAHDTWQQALAILDNLAHPNATEVRSKLQRAGKKYANQ
jgi:tetratricopeptide (TPR) repeat protein/transcriptional regulator with XRE-family HTH domain